jgi:hypothetical protein
VEQIAALSDREVVDNCLEAGHEHLQEQFTATHRKHKTPCELTERCRVKLCQIIHNCSLQYFVEERRSESADCKATSAGRYFAYSHLVEAPEEQFFKLNEQFNVFL